MAIFQPMDMAVAYVLGLSLGWTVFKALFIPNMIGGSYLTSLRKTLIVEFLSMNALDGGDVAGCSVRSSRHCDDADAANARNLTNCEHGAAGWHTRHRSCPRIVGEQRRNFEQHEPVERGAPFSKIDGFDVIPRTTPEATSLRNSLDANTSSARYCRARAPTVSVNHAVGLP